MSAPCTSMLMRRSLPVGRSSTPPRGASGVVSSTGRRTVRGVGSSSVVATCIDVATGGRTVSCATGAASATPGATGAVSTTGAVVTPVATVVPFSVGTGLQAEASFVVLDGVDTGVNGTQADSVVGTAESLTLDAAASVTPAVGLAVVTGAPA